MSNASLTANDLPNTERLMAYLRRIRKAAEDPATGGEIDVRLQVLGPGGEDWFLHHGDASYDLDHSGVWGASSVAAGDSDACLSEIARGLREDVLGATYWGLDEREPDTYSRNRACPDLQVPEI